MSQIWRKAIEQELDEKDVELLNILAEERKFEDSELKDISEKLKIPAHEVKARMTELKKKRILLKDKVSIIDPMRIWDGYYLIFVKVNLVPPIISNEIEFPTGWRVEKYIERFRQREKEMKMNIIREAYCLQGTEWDVLLILSALSQSDFVEFMDKLTKEGWIQKAWSVTPVEFGGNWIFDPVAMPSKKTFQERVKNIKISASPHH